MLTAARNFVDRFLMYTQHQVPFETPQDTIEILIALITFKGATSNHLIFKIIYVKSSLILNIWPFEIMYVESAECRTPRQPRVPPLCGW